MTNETKHTKGPWHRNIRADGKYPVIFAGRNQHVALATQQEDSEETEANIDLIAAAPELLEALELLLPLANAYLHILNETQGYEDPGLKLTLKQIKIANEAINKAKGQ